MLALECQGFQSLFLSKTGAISSRSVTGVAKLKKYILLFALSLITVAAISQDYKGLIQTGDYSGALKIINSRLKEYYELNIEYRKLPSPFISDRENITLPDLKKLFRERKVRPFFIEEKPEIAELHLEAGRCSIAIKQYRSAVSHLIQSLRYRAIEPGRDDVVFAELARAHALSGNIRGQVDALEAAFSLAPDKYNYSLELAGILSRGVDRKRAIFHLERYISSLSGDVDPELYIKLAGLHEAEGGYLDAEASYVKYLEKKTRDGGVHFALGVISCRRTGNFALARRSFTSALELLPEEDYFRRSKSYEHIADMFMKDVEYRKAIEAYLRTVDFQNNMLKKVADSSKRIDELSERIRLIKAELVNKRNYDRYMEYEDISAEKGRLEVVHERLKHEYQKLNPGAVRWNLARAYESTGQLEDAVRMYRDSLSLGYNSAKSRENMEKLRLKIKRGY